MAFAHNDHLKQGGKHAGQGGGKTRKNGSQYEQATSGGAGDSRTPPSQKGGKLSGGGTPGMVRQGPSRMDGHDHLTPHPNMTDTTPDKGASGSRDGVSNRTFNAGPGRSGSDKEQQPGLANAGKAQKSAEGLYYGKPSKKHK